MIIRVSMSSIIILASKHKHIFPHHFRRDTRLFSISEKGGMINKFVGRARNEQEKLILRKNKMIK